MTSRLSIGIATAGRFHVLDLARELDALGHEVRLYSYVPRWRAEKFGLPHACHVGLLPALAPLLAWQRYAARLTPAWRETATYWALNRAVQSLMQPCDVFIAMSGMYLEAPRFARERFGAKVVIVRGSKHILAQQDILTKAGSAERASPISIERELAGYALAHMIDVPSTRAAASFAPWPDLAQKTVSNPYGVDLDMFPQMERASASTPEAIQFLFVGTWSIQKGCDLLIEAVERVPGIRLHHVGPMGDAPAAPVGSRIAHTAKCDQPSLSRHYRAADCLVLPSRQDGFGMVLTQALACGLAVLASTETGAPDLKAQPFLSDRITLVAAGSVDALVAGLIELRDRIRATGLPPALPASERERLSWRAYARRYQENLQRLLAVKSLEPGHCQSAVR